MYSLLSCVTRYITLIVMILWSNGQGIIDEADTTNGTGEDSKSTS